ncbi:MAG: FeoB-associated Cys-rich membrane protein [Eubacteriales bacterium]|nr:FeoB-associated Cys-rich membrane protein [Eubacteriales bacterium]
MNLQTLVLLGVLVLIIAAICFRLYKTRKNGGCCSCSSCPSCSSKGGCDSNKTIELLKKEK